VAPALLGRRLLRRTPEGLLGGTIVETEAYGGPEDRASHARAGLTRRTRPMFGPPGHAYIYLVYGQHWCFNIVTEEDGVAGAVLVRAIAPDVGIEEQRRRRGRSHDPVARLGAGPARLCQALAIDGGLDGIDLTLGPPLWVADAAPGTPPPAVVCGPRVGVGYAGEPWTSIPHRFGIEGHGSLSRPFAT